MSYLSVGLQNPATDSLVRQPGSVRRTTHVDMTPAGTGVAMSSAARDLLTPFDRGKATVVAEAALEAEVNVRRGLERLDITPADHRAQGLIGLSVGSGFRAAVDDALPEHARDQTPLYLLLEELPVATLISGYATLYRRPDIPASRAPKLPADICAGWVHDGTMMVAIDETGQVPVPVGPSAPGLDESDPEGWHELAPLAPGGMRRQRLVDVAWGDPVSVGAMFRDTHVEPDGTVTVLHEYQLRASVDPGRQVVLECEATPRVLPWPECPSAAASARRLVGAHVGDIRTLVRRDLRGTTTCTHLNDLLRSLGDVGALLRQLADQLPE